MRNILLWYNIYFIKYIIYLINVYVISIYLNTIYNYENNFA
jgi:hypothetical protein